ncbi:hypothetical protein IAT38_005856 [Cryptococcus sp. DSM 104549]
MADVVVSEKYPQTAINSPAVRVPGLIFCSGQIAKGEIRSAALEALTNLKAVLELGGSSLEQIAKVNIFLKDINDMQGTRDEEDPRDDSLVRGADPLLLLSRQFMPNPKPARTCVQAGALPAGDDTVIELECIARI